jgi:predicted lipoprotein
VRVDSQDRRKKTGQFWDMIKDAILTLGDADKGATLQDIQTFIEENYLVNQRNYKAVLAQALQKNVQLGKLQRGVSTRSQSAAMVHGLSLRVASLLRSITRRTA